MRILVLLLLILISDYSFSQSTRRFFQPISVIFMDNEYEGIPKELEFLKTWSRNKTSSIFFSDLQRSVNPRSSASFNSLKLIIKKDVVMDFMQTGLIMTFIKKQDVNTGSIKLLNNNLWRIQSYNSGFTLSKFDPQDNGMNFLYLELFNNSTDQQTLAHFISNHTRTCTGIEAKMKCFIKAINSKNNLHIDTNTLFDNFCDSLHIEKPNSDCNYSAYIAFLEDKDPITSRKNINKFFRSFSPTTVEELIDDIMLPNGSYTFQDTNVRITLPRRFFKSSSSSKKEAIQFYLSSLDYNLKYDFVEASYYFEINLKSFSNTINQDFTFKIKEFDYVTDKRKKSNYTVKQKDFKSLDLRIYPNYYTVTINSTKYNGSDYPLPTKLYKRIKFNQTSVD